MSGKDMFAADKIPIHGLSIGAQQRGEFTLQAVVPWIKLKIFNKFYLSLQVEGFISWPLNNIPLC